MEEDFIPAIAILTAPKRQTARKQTGSQLPNLERRPTPDSGHDDLNGLRGNSPAPTRNYEQMFN
jgi:hypothetical protein